MTSRLERLFVLLETGQSTFLRKSAAFQIGQVVKTHPGELGQLLEKLKSLVTSSSWETRIAASQTIEAIIKNLDDKDLILIPAGTYFDDHSKLDQFNLNELLINGAKLLSSDTQKYDIKDNEMTEGFSILSGNKTGNLNDILTEKIHQQRKLLNLKLGIDVGGAAKLDTTHIFSDYDLIVSNTNETIVKSMSIATTSTSLDLNAQVNLKRKVENSSIEDNKETIKCEPFLNNEEINTHVKSEELYSVNKKFKKSTSVTTEQSMDEETNLNNNTINHVKSLELFTQWLLNKLFDSDWEHRHGAATSLREIIKGLVYSLMRHFEQEALFKNNDCVDMFLNLNWFQDCLVKMLSVIALDRFADYVGDEAVAPVRETCAQTIGIISSLFCFNDNSVNLRKLCSIINMFLNDDHSENCWEVRHSGIMILKYTIAATTAASTNSKSITSKNLLENLDFDNLSNELPIFVSVSKSASPSIDNLKLIFDLTFDNILSCIKDKDDDVRQVASASLKPVSKLLNKLLSETKLESLIRILIDVLSDIDDLGTSCTNIMCLLSDLLSASDEENLNSDIDFSSNNINFKDMFLRLLNGQSVIPRILPFLQHTNINVKKTTLNTINKIIVAINSGTNSNKISFESLETNENLTILFRLLYQQAILLPSEYAFQNLENLLETLWTTLCYKLSPHCLINICFPYITTWLLLFMHPSNQPIDSVYLISNLNTINTTSVHNKTTNQNINSSLNSPNTTNVKQTFNLIQTTSYSEVKEYIGSNQTKFEDKLTRDTIQIKCRLLAARLLSILFNRIALIDELDANSKEKPIILIINFLSSNVNFKSGLQRFCFAILMIEWGVILKKTNSSSVSDLITNKLSTKIISCLDDENTIVFDEIALLFTRLQKECRSLLSSYSPKLSKFKIDISKYSELNVFTFEDINNIANLIQNQYLNNPNYAISSLEKFNSELKLFLSNLIELNQQATQEQDTLSMRSSFSLASAAIELNFLSEKMNPLIRPLVDCIRFESNADLQLIASKHLAMLLSTCSKRTPNPVPKIFKNLLNYLCNDSTKTLFIQNMLNITTLPDKEWYDLNRFYGILSDTLSLNYQQHTVDIENPCATPKAPKKRTGSVSDSDKNLNEQLMIQQQQQQQLIKLQIEKRGAEYTFKSICEFYNSKLETIIPEIIQQPINQIHLIISFPANTNNFIASNDLAQIEELNLDVNLQKYQDLVNYLNLLEFIILCGCLNKQILNDNILKEIPNMMKLIKSPITNVRHFTCRCLAAICKQELIKSMSLMLESIFESLEHSEFNLFSRQGAIELVYCIFEKLNELIIPFTVIFIVPVLKRMCDLDWYVRSIASQCFATLVKLYPLGTAASASLTENNQIDSLSQITLYNENILKMKLEQQDFLDQLMDNRKLKAYELPFEVLINVKLRPYQQMGINWLAFLKKFNLHGILCDDMGLGKTLQSICILAGDHYEKHIEAQSNGKNKLHSNNDEEIEEFLPSIIICPTTLTNHWYHEIDRFVDSKCLKPFIYSGSVCEREHLRSIFFNSKHISHANNGIKNNKNKQLHTLTNAQTNAHEHRHNVFIVSYEIVRHDIQYICNQRWNYCILDEGHLIKSSKTKLSKSIKQIKASHRLILTGTPIQNNVTELWCLFDFLIPGYLGTEKQFHLKYARYIAPQSASFQKTLERAMSHQNNNNKSNENSSNNDKNNNGNNSSNNKGFHQLSLIALETLHKQVLPFLLRRTKDEVLDDLPPKIIQDYYCEMSQLQIELYQDFAKSEISSHIKKSFGLIDGYEDTNEEFELSGNLHEEPDIKQGGQSEHVFQALQYLRKVVNHPLLVLKPDHPKWSKIQADLRASNSSINEVKHSGKLVALRELLMECGIGLSSNNQDTDESCSATTSNSLTDFESTVLNQHRVLIFCQLKSMIDIIENELLKKMTNVSYLRLDGTVAPADRFGVVKRFNSDPSIDILLLTTHIGGLGLNLTGADTVIFVEHDWNPQKDLQAMDRAHRIGQTKVVNVYRLITKRTIEEKIMSLQKFKLGVADSIVNIENSSLSSMGTEQIMNMFNKDELNSQKKDSSSVTTGSSTSTSLPGSSNYQKLIENINDLWDESQYENEYNLDNFIKTLHK